MSISKRLVSNTVYLFFSWFFITLFSFLYWLIVGKTLSPSSFGIIATSLQIAMIVSTLTLLGANGAINKLLPEFVVKKQRDRIQGLINFSFRIVLLTSLSAALTLFLLSHPLSSAIGLPLEAVWIISGLIVLIPLAVLTARIFYGFQNMKGLFLTNSLGHLIKVVTGGGLIFLGFNYFGPLIGLLVCFFTLFISRVRRCLKIFPVARINKRLFFKYSSSALVVGILFQVLNNSHYILLSTLKTTTVAGLFALAMTISSVIPVIPTTLNQALFPITSGLSVGKDGRSKQSYLVKLVFRYSLFFSFPIAISLIFFAKYAILFFSREIYLPASSILPVLSVSGIFLGLGNLFHSSLYAIRRPKEYRNIYVLVTFVYLISAIPLTYLFSAEGLATSYLFTTFIFFLISLSSLKRYMRIKLPYKDIARILFSASASLLFLLFLQPFVHGFLEAGIVLFSSSLVYLSILLKMDFYLQEDVKVIDLLARKIPFLKKQFKNFRNWFATRVRRSYSFT